MGVLTRRVCGDHGVISYFRLIVFRFFYFTFLYLMPYRTGMELIVLWGLVCVVAIAYVVWFSTLTGRRALCHHSILTTRPGLDELYNFDIQ